MRSERGLSRRWISLGLAAASCLTACGGAGTYNDALGRAAPPGTDLPAENQYQVIPPLLAPAVTAPSGSQASAFCQDVQQLQGLPQIFVAPTAGATSLDRTKALIDRLPADAPATIRPAAVSLAQDIDQLVADLRGSPPKVSDLPLAVNLETSLQQVIGFATTNC